jgi:hypothetical protein
MLKKGTAYLLRSKFSVEVSDERTLLREISWQRPPFDRGGLLFIPDYSSP